MTEGGGYVHHEDPFVTPPEQREPVRRLRGALADGVTIWTSGSGAERAGLTMSSVLVAEGEPSLILGLVNDTTDLYSALVETKTFVVHVLDASGKVLADRFAGLRPSPGGLFAGLDVDDTAWGPALHSFQLRASCRLRETRSLGYHELVAGEIERIELANLDRPLVYFRGRYRALVTNEDD